MSRYYEGSVGSTYNTAHVKPRSKNWGKTKSELKEIELSYRRHSICLKRAFKITS